MSLTADELAALARAMDMRPLEITANGTWIRSIGTEGGTRLTYFAADVLTWLVKEGAAPVLNTYGPPLCELWADGKEGANEAKSYGDTWPLAILKVAARYQVEKESR